MIRVALDAIGGDSGPRVAFECAINVISNHSNIEIQFFYHQSFSIPTNLLRALTSGQRNRLTLISCADLYSANDEVSRALFRRTDTSLYQALLSLKNKQSDVVVTFGNTGIMVALARYILGLLKPKLYPTLIRELSLKPLRCLTDLGANVHCAPQMLLGFSELAAAYVEELSNEKANVGLLNVGLEASKGSDVVRETNDLLSSMNWPHYSGYAEGYELFQGSKNVIICDGMVGNAVLKASEGLFHFLMKKLNDQGVMDSALMSFYQTERRHGACLVGVRGNLVKGHGESDVKAMIGAVEYAVKIAQAQLSEKIAQRLM
ncbi:fatty acid synthesis protein [Marinomonas agarivorans]|nr:fatty acid synthesis protein [Marinomonas agarivorans]